MKLISKLNKNENIMTLYSCEGHNEKDDAHLFFTVNQKGWDIFWQNIMPELSERFCQIHPEIPHALFQTEWLSSVTEKGISILTSLNNFYVEESGRIVVGWEEKKKNFWNVVEDMFLKNFIYNSLKLMVNVEDENIEEFTNYCKTNNIEVMEL